MQIDVELMPFLFDTESKLYRRIMVFADQQNITFEMAVDVLVHMNFVDLIEINLSHLGID